MWVRQPEVNRSHCRVWGATFLKTLMCRGVSCRVFNPSSVRKIRTSRGSFRAVVCRLNACCPGFRTIGPAGPGRKAMNGKTLFAMFARVTLLVPACLVVLLCGAALLRAQVDTGTILGTVSDASGGSVHGATVTLTNEGTNATLATTTGSDGTYKFSPVRIGSYKLTATIQGFQTITQRNVVVNVGQDVVVDFTLKPGSVSETVEVASTIPVLETQDASVGQVIDSRNVDNLPLNGRNFTFLAQLAAGVNTPQADTRGNAASGAFAANGLRPAQNNYLLDGIDNNSDTVDFLNGTNFVVLPPVDAIEEFKVQTSDFSAEFGRSGAAVLNATIKSGTNNFHGTAWEFFRND